MVYLDTKNQIISEENLKDIRQDLKQEEKQLSLEDFTLPKQPEKTHFKPSNNLERVFQRVVQEIRLRTLKNTQEIDCGGNASTFQRQKSVL